MSDALRSGLPLSNRERNLALVVTRLYRWGAASRTDIATATGLSRAATNTLVAELVDRDLIAEVEVAPTGQSGRPSRPLVVTGSWGLGLGLDTENPDEIRGAVVDLGGTEVATVVGSSPEEVVTLFDNVIDEGRHVIVGATIGTAASAVPGGGSRIEDATEQLQALGCDTVDVIARRSAVAYAEFRSRQLRPTDTLVSIVGESELSLGLVVEGAPLIGAASTGGHILVASDGLRCRCGLRGCWSTVLGVEGVLREAAPDLAGNPLAETSPTALVPVRRRAIDGEESTIGGLAVVGRWLGVGIATIDALLAPEAITLHGYLADLAPWIVERALDVVPDRSDRSIIASGVGPDAAAIGAAAMAVEVLVSNPAALEPPAAAPRS